MGTGLGGATGAGGGAGGGATGGACGNAAHALFASAAVAGIAANMPRPGTGAIAAAAAREAQLGRAPGLMALSGFGVDATGGIDRVACGLANERVPWPAAPMPKPGLACAVDRGAIGAG